MNKLGPHVLHNTPRLGELIAAKPAVLKLVGDWSLQAPEETLLIGRKRLTYDAQSQYNAGIDPVTAAEIVVNDTLPVITANPHIEKWEGHNEAVLWFQAGMEWYAEHEMARMEMMASIGKIAVIGNWASGCPPMELWPYFMPALAEAAQAGHYLGLHEYGYPWMWWMTGPYQIDPDEDQGDEGWTTLRYRKLWRQYVEPAGLINLRIIITETGLDPLVNPKPPNMREEDITGFRGLGPYWAENQDGEVEYHPDPEIYYWRQLLWYNNELMKDYYVMGGTVFCHGHWGPDCAWLDFDIADTKTEEKMIMHIEANPAGQQEAPSPPPEPDPDPLEPEEVIDVTDEFIDNASFEGGTTRDTHDGRVFGEIDVPEGFTFWYEEGEYRRPEAKLIHRSLDEVRVADGDQAYKVYTFYGRMLAGLYKVLEGLEPGETYLLTAQAHAWSAHDEPLDVPGPHCSVGVGCGPVFIREEEIPPLSEVPPDRDPTVEEMENDAIGNFVFRVGTSEGPPDPFGDVDWGEGAAIYNGYYDVPYHEFTAPESGQVVIYLKAHSLWAFRNSDAYWDNVRLYHIVEGEADPVPPPDPEVPTVDYEVKVLVPKPTEESFNRAAEDAKKAENLNSVVFSLHDVRRLISVLCPSGETGLGVFYDVKTAERQQEIRDFMAEMEPTGRVQFKDPLFDYIDLVDQLEVNPESPFWPYKQRTMSDIEWMIVHHTAGPKLSGQAAIDNIKSIARFHCYDPHRLYPGIGYVVMIDGEGQAYLVNHVETVSYAHGVWGSGRDENRMGVPVCLLGNYTQYEPTDMQLQTLHQVYAWLNAMTPKDLSIHGHKDLVATACPGSSWPWVPGWGGNPGEDPDPPSDPDPMPPTPVLKSGLHDEPGGDWMRDHGYEGWCLAHSIIKTHGAEFDFTHLERAGIKVILRLNWGYATGEGTVPPSEHASQWVAAMQDTIQRSRGVWGFQIANEVNNISEWPGYPNPTFYPTPEYYAQLYRQIAAGVAQEKRLAPQPLDPYHVMARNYGLPGDPKLWAETIYANIDRIDFHSIHAKTQSNNPAEVFSWETFTDAPLIGRFMHTRTVQDQLSWIPAKWRDRPVIITELNPQRISEHELGWVPGNTPWVHEVLRFFREEVPVDGIIAYRYELAGGNQEGFALLDKPDILQALFNA